MQGKFHPKHSVLLDVKKWSPEMDHRQGCIMIIFTFNISMYHNLHNYVCKVDCITRFLIMHTYTIAKELLKHKVCM